MLHELLERHTAGGSRLDATTTIRSCPGDGVIQQVTVEALRLNGKWDMTQAGFLEGHFVDIRRHRTAVLQAIAAISAETDSIGAAGYRRSSPGASHLLCIDTVQVTEAERGHGLGLTLVAAALCHLGSGRTIDAILHPHPIGAAAMDPDAVIAASAKLARHWSRLGFTPVPGNPSYQMLRASDFNPSAVLGG